MRFQAIYRGVGLVAGVAGWLVCSPAAGAQGAVRGRVTLMEKPGTKTTDLENAIVWLEATSPTTARVRAEKAEVVMRARKFTPHVRVITTGSTVEFPNQDPFSHNIFSSAAGNAFDLGLYGRGQKKAQTFTKTGPVPVYCNVHSNMTAFVVVIDSPHFAQAGADGRWEIAGVPAGSYTLHIWHERATAQNAPLTVPAGGAEVAEARLDARGYVFVQHKDKFGKPYVGLVRY